jgi:hypothetical protein
LLLIGLYIYRLIKTAREFNVTTLELVIDFKLCEDKDLKKEIIRYISTGVALCGNDDPKEERSDSNYWKQIQSELQIKVNRNNFNFRHQFK